MTATTRNPSSPGQHRRFRLSVMESLGFFEDSVTRTTWSNGTVVASPGAQTATVAQPDVDPFDDWQTTAIEKRLVTGNIRWSSIIGVLLICAGVAGIAAWFYQRPVELAKEALAELAVTAQALEPALLLLQDANDQVLLDGSGATSITSTLLDVDGKARDLFESSAALPSSQTTARSRAADAASEAIDASRLLGDSLAFQAALVPVLALPEFVTDPNLIALDEAARAFGEWQARFDGVRSALPAGVMSPVSIDLAVISGELGATQSRYLDALRSDDPAAAAATFDGLSARLETAYLVLSEELAQTQARVSVMIASALAAIDLLVG